jgi:hypothetical protein
MKSLIELVREEQCHYRTYTEAVNYAIVQTHLNGYQTKDEDQFQIIRVNTKKPKVGETTQFNLPLYKAEKSQREMLHVKVYGLESGLFELHFYVS